MRDGVRVMAKIWRALWVGLVITVLLVAGYAAAVGGRDRSDRVSPVATLTPLGSSSPSTSITPAASASSTPGVSPSTSSASAKPTPSSSATLDSGQAVRVLSTLRVAGRAPRTGYSRDQFGQRWYDADRNGCDTRNDILRRDLTRVVLKPDTHGCVALSGVLVDPYTGRALQFTRGAATSNQVQIDHVVSLSDAWQKGAQKLSPERRREFANDPLNLLTVEGRTNTAKSDSDAASWLPSRKDYRCRFVARQIAVKAKYGLWVTPAEREAMARLLSRCPGEALPSG